MELGIYESLITETLKSRLDHIDRNEFYVADQKKLDADEAVHFLAMHLGAAVKNALKLIKAEKKDLLVAKQIEITNNILQYLTQEISQYEFADDLVYAEGLILEGVLAQLNSKFTDVKLHLSEIMPLTRLTQSELFTGGNVGLSLDAELKKEIRSSDRIDLLVSFIKWKAIVILRDAFEEFTSRGDYKSMIANKLIATESLSYFQFILELIHQDFELANIAQSETNDLLATVVFYDFYQSASKEMTLEEGIRKIGENRDMIKELYDFISLKIAQINYEEFPLEDLAFSFPLKLHSRYTREQIMVAMRLTTVNRRDSGVSGVAENKALNCEALFVNLKKSEEDFSPTTMYDDYAINESLFHWQSQNQTAHTSEKGKSYILQQEKNKTILLFVRESKTDADGFTKGYVFVGPVNFVDFTGSKPMSITWQLDQEMPHFLWQESAKLRVG